MEDAKEQIVQESKNSTLPSQDEKNPFVPGREIPPDAQDQIQRFYHENEEFQDCEVRAEGHEGTPHEALILALGYLGVQDLFLIENVCTSLRSVVQNDPLLWRDIHINPPLNEKITDDVLLQIIGRGQGSLQCLSLVDCQRITDEGLNRAVENNPKLIKPCFQ
ncbi:F-box protein SKIP14 [Gossypium raimondii]|uniref:F-box protein SKIP14 n=1 Tax=Gossypium raimondii TaxID=29730 RepID=UPI00227C7F1F|nr:F-box protein SKIP14 [Gossypium raimondii]